MNEGIMAPQAAHLSDAQKRHITEYVTRTPADQDLATAIPWCESRDLGDTPPELIGWGHDTNRSTHVSQGGIPKDQVEGLTLKWSFTYPGALRTRSQPSVGWDTLFTGSQDGTVYAFDLDTGCVKWAFQAAAEVRTGIVLTPGGMAFFGDILAKVYALNAKTGELVWQERQTTTPVPPSPAPRPIMKGGCTFPSLHWKWCLQQILVMRAVRSAAASSHCKPVQGRKFGRHYTIPSAPKEIGRTSVGAAKFAPSGAPVWSSPTIDVRRNLLYVGTGENYSSPADENSDAILAIDLDTGERAWQRQSTAGDAWNVACMMADNPNCPEEDGPDFDHGSSILLVQMKGGKEVLAAGHKDGTVFILDPNNKGALLWTERLGRGSIQGGVHFGMAASEGAVHVPIKRHERHPQRGFSRS